MVTTRTGEVCRHCGSNLIIPNDEGKPYCLMCCRPIKRKEKNDCYITDFRMDFDRSGNGIGNNRGRFHCPTEKAR